MPNIYFAIAKLNGMEELFCVKKVEVDWNTTLSTSANEFNFDLDGAETIYVGRFKKSHEVGREKINFHLLSYKSKLNELLYKINLEKLICRVAFDCDHLLIKDPLTNNLIGELLDKEQIRQDEFDNPKELVGDARKKIFSEYEALEKDWLNFWKKSYNRIESFYKKNPKPQENNYVRKGLSSLVLGKFDAEEYKNDLSSHNSKLNWLCKQISEEFKELKIGFDVECPGECNRKIFFSVDFDHEGPDKFYSLSDDFDFGIYKKLFKLVGYCSDCISYKLTFSTDDYTCIFHNYHPEIITLISRILKNSFAYEIEQKLYD